MQIWSPSDDPATANLLSQGYDVIVSHYDWYYLDCGRGSWAEKEAFYCDPYKQWRDIYDYK